MAIDTLTSAELAELVLPEGQIGYDRRGNVMKVGDGETAWPGLKAIKGGGGGGGVPDAPQDGNTYAIRNGQWVALDTDDSGTVLTSFTNGASVNPNGANGISIVGKNADNDVTLSAASDAIRLQQTSGGTTTTLLQLPGTLSADVAALQTGKQDKGNYVLAEDSGWLELTGDGVIFRYCKKNGLVSVAYGGAITKEIAANVAGVTVATLPSGFRPTVGVSGVGTTQNVDVFYRWVIGTDGTIKIGSRTALPIGTALNWFAIFF